jgi:hypothetical protein
MDSGEPRCYVQPRIRNRSSRTGIGTPSIQRRIQPTFPIAVRFQNTILIGYNLPSNARIIITTSKRPTMPPGAYPQEEL